MEEARSPKILSFVIVMLVIVALSIWFFVALPDQDWLWFLPIFNEQASEIRLYRNGQEIRLFPGDPGYDELNRAINTALSGIKAKLGGGVSEATLEDYYNKYSAVEVLYDEPIIIHSHHAFRKCDKLLFPLSGRHHDPPRVFGGSYARRDYRAGALVLKNPGPLLEAVESVWAAHEADRP